MRIRKFIPLVLCFALLSGCASAGGGGEPSDNTDGSSYVTEPKEGSAAETSGAEPSKIDPDKPVIALTFDDGPNNSITPRVLDRLEKYDAVGTFFLIGNNISDKTADTVKRACDMGCEIECHSLTHRYMDKMTAEEIKTETETASQRIYDITGRRPTFFRPPYFAVSSVMFENIDMTFITGFGVNDWEASVSAEQRAEGVLKAAKDGAVILLHDMEGNFKTIEALDTIIPALKDEGYQLVTVSQLFEAKGADPTDAKYRGRVISTVE